MSVGVPALDQDGPRRVALRFRLQPLETPSVVILLVLAIGMIAFTYHSIFRLYDLRHHGVQTLGVVTEHEIIRGKGGGCYLHVKYLLGDILLNGGFGVVGRYKVDGVNIDKCYGINYVNVVFMPGDVVFSELNIDNFIYNGNFFAHYYGRVFYSVLAVILWGSLIRERIIQFRLLKWGVAAPAVIVEYKNVSFRNHRWGVAIYKFTDSLGLEVQGRVRRLPTTDAFGIKQVARRAELLDNPIVIYDPLNSRRCRLYPMPCVRLKDA